MSDLDDRLTALDPAAGPPYQHRDLESLISRITAQPQVAPRRRWHNLELKLASFLVAGSLVVAGGFALLEGSAPVLPALALQQTRSTFAPSATKAASVGPIQIYEQFDFHAGATIAASAPSSSSYPLTVPSDGSREAARVAAVFGVAGTPVNVNGDGSDWTVSDAAGASLDYENTGVPQWYYSSASPTVAPATASDSASGPVPSPATLASDVQRFEVALGYGYTLASPDFGTSTISETNASGGPVSLSTADVTYTVVVNGVPTDQTVNFSVDPTNTVINASGPALRVGAPVNYPLQSPVAGVGALNAQQRAKYGSDSKSPPLVNATLSGETISLATYQLADGSLWLLPVYDYRGDVTNATGVASSGTWSELAVDPSYAHVGSANVSVKPGALKF